MPFQLVSHQRTDHLLTVAYFQIITMPDTLAMFFFTVSQTLSSYPSEAVIFSDMEKHGGYVILDSQATKGRAERLAYQKQ